MSSPGALIALCPKMHLTLFSHFTLSPSLSRIIVSNSTPPPPSPVTLQGKYFNEGLIELQNEERGGLIALHTYSYFPPVVSRRENEIDDTDR